MAKIISLVKPTRAEIVYVASAFDKAKECLEAENYKIASAEDVAKARIEQGKDAEVSRTGGWTKEGFLYLPSKEVFLTKNSLIMANAKEATNCHRNGNEFYLTKEQLEQSLEGSVKITNKPIPTNRFGENEATVHLFGETAQKYGEFLKEAGIKQMPVYLTDTQEKPFARQLWFRSLGGYPGLCGDSWNLDCYLELGCGNEKAFGVREKK